RLPDARRGDTRHLRAHGDVAPLRHHRAASRPDRAGAVWTWPEGRDGDRGAPGRRHARLGVALGEFQLIRMLRHGWACPGHTRFDRFARKSWMPGTSPGMTRDSIFSKRVARAQR